jgi:hypothetical protein
VIAVFLRRILVLAMLLALTGGQWFVLQSAAWAGMLVAHLRAESLPTALTNTFDGQHPCPLCKAIERGKNSEKKSDVEIKITRVEFPPLDRVCDLIAPEHVRSFTQPADEFAESLQISPLLRPPRLIPA